MHYLHHLILKNATHIRENIFLKFQIAPTLCYLSSAGSKGITTSSYDTGKTIVSFIVKNVTDVNIFDPNYSVVLVSLSSILNVFHTLL